MATQSILITAMPNGVSESGELQVSILFSPRLDAQNSPQQLSTFGDFIDWPATLGASQLIVNLGAEQWSLDMSLHDQGSVKIDSSSASFDSALWQTMLPSNSYVKGFNFEDMSSKKILSFNVASFAERQKKLYKTLATQVNDDLPKIKQLRASGPWQKLMDDVREMDRIYGEDEQALPRNVTQQFDDFIAGKLASNQSQEQQELALFQLFHTPAVPPKEQSYTGLPVESAKLKAKWQSYQATPLPSQLQLANKYDFHQIIAAMNQYPLMLRKMGLVVDIVINTRGLNISLDNLLSVELRLPPSQGNQQRQPSVSTKVQCRVKGRAFYAVSNVQQPVSIDKGLLGISAEHFLLVQHDVDGTGIKAMNMARTLERQAKDKVRLDPTSRQERDIGVPALRNAGLMLVQRQRAERLSQRFSHNKLLNNKIIAAQQAPANQQLQNAPILYAEDINRGFRIDIWDSHSKEWHSVCRRVGTYNIEAFGNFINEDEEGVIRLAATQSPNRSYLTDVLYLHETLMCWSGWSLCAPAPGNIVDEHDAIGAQEAMVPNGMPLSTTFRVQPGTLPRLRYGRRYWVRARSVDLAGNSLAPVATNIDREKPDKNAQAYWRYDPLKPPVLALYKPTSLLLEEPQEGESMQRMAIRTFNHNPSLNTVDTDQHSHRFALCDSASVKDAELHGMLDTGGQVDPSYFALLATKDVSLAQQDVVSIPPAVPVPNSPPLGTTSYAVLTEGGMHPYLPDALCITVAARLIGHPTYSEKDIIPITIYNGNLQWPHALPFKIRLYEKNGEEPQFITQSRTLAIPLPKAYRIKLRLSVMPDKATLNLMGIWNLLTETEKNKLLKRALNGQHWMLTPWREIELVHAVQKPLITPDPSISMIREKYKTWAIPKYKSAISLKSTERVDLMASWHEPTLDEIQRDIRKEGNAFSVNITETANYQGTPHHRILKPDLIAAGSKDNPGLVDKIHEFGDTRYRRVNYWLDATTKFREYMPAAVLTKSVKGDIAYSDEQIKVTGPTRVAWVPNSAPPPIPNVLYLVPTYHWLRSKNGKIQQRLRRGRGIRVYMDGPWSASGYGEMLAVVLPSDYMNGLDPNNKPNSQAVKNFVTQWGNDPVWKSPFIKGPAPKVTDFPLRRSQPDSTGSWLPEFAEPEEADQPLGYFSTKNLSHPQIEKIRVKVGDNENNKKLVNIAPHDVFYDEQRGLWYCDIELSPKTTYYPFVRLALARYQPVSLKDCHLSNIVLSDFITLANDRFVTLNHGTNTQKLNVEVFGTTYSNSSGFDEAPTLTNPLPGGQTKIPDIHRTTVVEVWVEKLDPSLGEDFGWQVDELSQVIDTTHLPIRTRTLSQAQSDKLKANKTMARQLQKQGDYQAIQAAGWTDLLLTAPTLWRGKVLLPATDEEQRRIVVAEYEEYLIDDDAPYDGFVTKKGRRLVFVEHIVLN